MVDKMKPKKKHRRRHRTKSREEEHREYHAYVVCNDEEDFDYRVRRYSDIQK